ncbi:MAG TPA: hypothetical protein VNO55_29625, partial [Polyangia bacterium]|nr:hypothetical protein [Polyangia bacterium]
ALRYSLPWQLRPVTIGNLVRVDSVGAVFNEANGNLDEAVATVVTASYKINGSWAPTVRLGFVGNDAPGEATDGSSFANPLVGATYARSLGIYRLALFGATTLPVGTGGGDTPNIRAAKTNAASSTTRPADDAMFAVNYTTAIAGADLAYVNHGLTAQAEATLLQFVRVRGEHGIGATDPFRTKAALGLHLGYFIGSHFSLSSDLHYRRWLSHPTTLSAATGARIALSDADMASTTVSVGPRFHFRVGKQGWIRPGISFVRGFDARGFDAPLLTAQPTGVQVDVPVTF